MKDIAPMADVSWYHDYLPDYLWLLLPLRHVDRRRVMSAFRSTFDGLEKIRAEGSVKYLSHQGLSELTDLEFGHVVDPFLNDRLIRDALRPLLVLKDLPGLDRWEPRLKPPPENALEAIETAVANAAAQNSEAATDVAFMNFMALVAQDKFSMNPGLMDPDDINKYVADPKSAPRLAGMVRALRNGWSVHNRVESGHTRDWTDKFYDSTRRSTPCRGFYPSVHVDSEAFDEKISSITKTLNAVRLASSQRLTEGFQQNGYDELVEVLASLGLYASDIASSAVNSSDITYSHGAVLLRTLAEINIAISHMKDNPSAAARYRLYGAGRASLLLQKSEETGVSACYLFLPELNAVANERKASDFIDMPVNAFFQKSIRETAIECGAKEVYDTYYDVGAMYAHAEWGGVATSSVQMCVNPLHLGHYIPSFRIFTSEMLEDVHWLILRIASELDIELAGAGT